MDEKLPMEGMVFLDYYWDKRNPPSYLQLQYYSKQEITNFYTASNKKFFTLSKNKVTMNLVVYNGLEPNKNEKVSVYSASDKKCELQETQSDKYVKYTKKPVSISYIAMPRQDGYNSLLYSYWLNSTGEGLIHRVETNLQNATTPQKCYIFFYIVNKKGQKQVWSSFIKDNFEKFQKFNQQKQTRTISVPCESKDIAKVVYTKHTYQYCVDNKENKTLIYTNEETFAADLPTSDEMDKLQQKLILLQTEKDAANVLLDNLNKTLNKIENDLYSDSDYLKQIKKQKDEIDSMVNKCSNKHNEIFAQLQKIWKDIDNERANIESYYNQIKSIQNNNVSVVTQEEKQLYNKIRESQKKLAELQTKKETLGKEFDENYKKLQQLQKQQDQMWILLEQAQKKENEQNEKLTKQLQKIWKDISEKENEISQLDSEISSIYDKIAQLNKGLTVDQIKQSLGLKDQYTKTKDVWYQIAHVVDSRNLTHQNYQKQLKKFNEIYQNSKDSDKDWRHQDGVNACNKKCKDPGCFELGSGQSNNKQFMAKLKAKAAQYKKDYPEKDYNSVIRQTGGSNSYNDQNSISQYDYQSTFIICFTCKNKYLSQ